MLKAFSITNIGKMRKMNQDYVHFVERPIGNLPNLFLVADGMGGHNAGDFAAQLAVNKIIEQVAETTETDPVTILDKAIAVANVIVYKSAEASPELEGMGTTVVAAVCDGEDLYVANVGDSRLYVIRDREIKQITRDHSWVEEMVNRGGLTREDARNHPDKNIITRAIGVEETVRADYFNYKLKENDMILMCTDGLTNMVEDQDILQVLSGPGDIVQKAEELVRRANDNGGRDNISVMLIEP